MCSQPTGEGVGEPLVRHDLAGGAEVYDRIGHVGRVPKDDRGDKEVQPRGPVLLRLGAAVRDPSLLERADSLSVFAESSTLALFR